MAGLAARWGGTRTRAYPAPALLAPISSLFPLLLRLSSYSWISGCRPLTFSLPKLHGRSALWSPARGPWQDWRGPSTVPNRVYLRRLGVRSPGPAGPGMSEDLPKPAQSLHLLPTHSPWSVAIPSKGHGDRRGSEELGNLRSSRKGWGCSSGYMCAGSRQCSGISSSSVAPRGPRKVLGLLPLLPHPIPLIRA